MNKIYKNEALFAEANKKMALSTARLSPGFPKDFELKLYCECANKACLERVTVAYESYIKRPEEQTFYVKPQHYLPEFERVTKKTPEYWTVAKRPEKLAKNFEI